LALKHNAFSDLSCTLLYTLIAVAYPQGTSPSQICSLPCADKACCWPLTFCLGRGSILLVHTSVTAYRARVYERKWRFRREREFQKEEKRDRD